MINLIFLLFVVIGYNYHFWFIMSITTLVCRFRLNRYYPQLIMAVISSISILILPYLLPRAYGIYVFPINAILLITLSFWSLYYNFYTQKWKNDFVFVNVFIIERNIWGF